MHEPMDLALLLYLFSFYFLNESYDIRSLLDRKRVTIKSCVCRSVCVVRCMFVVIALVKTKWLCDLPLFDYLKGKKTLAVIVSKLVRN